jgi:hypothetical protein
MRIVIALIAINQEGGRLERQPMQADLFSKQAPRPGGFTFRNGALDRN